MNRCTHKALTLVLGSLSSVLVCVSAHAQQLASTPPMGWNSWNWFAGKVTDADIRKAADLLISSGMRDAGYIYVNIDDTWEGERDAAGVLHANAKFPEMKALADYVHSKGLKFGIYTSPGPLTCERFPGSYGHEQQDADMFAAWGVDFVKYDICGFRDIMAKTFPNDLDARDRLLQQAYETMHKAILKTGRPMVYSISEGGSASVWNWGAVVGANMWRTTPDIHDSYDRMINIASSQVRMAKYAGPGHWNDPDMLEVGNGKFTADENRTHMSLWAILAAPLIAGNNLTQMTPDVLAVLTNREVIAIDQDKMGKEGDLVWAGDSIQIWARPLANGDQAYAIVNLGRDRNKMEGLSLHLAQIGFPMGVRARDIWAGRDLGVLHDSDVFTVPAHGTIFLRLARVTSER